MGKSIRVLIIEDSEDDALLLVERLKRGGFTPVWKRVYSAESLSSALSEQTWDMVFSDHSMPGFGSFQALAVLKEAETNLPCIIVSGAISDQEAISAIDAGAQDFLLKDDLSRLIPIVERELLAAQNRREREELERTQRENQARKTAILESALDC